MERIGYDSAFLFKYSPRAGARSAEWEDSVPDDEKTRRLTILIEQQKRVSLERNLIDVGSTAEVLVEGPTRRHPGQWFGKTRQFKTAVFPHGAEQVGDLITMRVAAASPYALFGDRAALDTLGATEDVTS